MMACVTGWFETRRSLAVSLVSAGMGMAPMTMSPLAAWLVSHYDWRTALLIISALVAAIMIPVAFLVRSPPALAGQGAAAIADQDSGPEMSRGQALRSPQFIILLADELFLLRHPFRPDLPHRELCRDLRHTADHCRVDL